MILLPKLESLDLMVHTPELAISLCEPLQPTRQTPPFKGIYLLIETPGLEPHEGISRGTDSFVKNKDLTPIAHECIAQIALTLAI